MKTLTMKELREIVSEQIVLLQRDESTPAKANAIVNGVGKILTSVRLELEYAKLRGKRPVVAVLDV